MLKLKGTSEVIQIIHLSWYIKIQVEKCQGLNQSKSFTVRARKRNSDVTKAVT